MENTILCPHCLSRMEAGKQQCPFCEKALTNTNPPGALAYASLLAGRYTVGRHIATDGEGIFYEAIENSGGVKVMIKEYLPVTLCEGREPDGDILPKEGSEVLFKTTRMDFSDLYHSLMRITPTTGLLAVLDVFEDHNTVYAVMERLSGETLAHLLSKEKRVLTPAEARSLLQPIMEGVAAIHKAGLVHRGISPANIMITSGGSARLCGYATLGLRNEGSQLKSQLYEGYSAPEQYSEAEFEGRYTDVYGLAAVFYRLVSGQRPDSAQQRKVKDSLPSARRLEPSVPGYITQVLVAAMSLDPASRVQNVPELMGALSSPAAAENLAKRSGVWEAAEKTKKSGEISAKSLFAGSLVVILCLFLLIMWLVLGGRTPEKTPPQSNPISTQEPVKIKEIPNVVGTSYKQLMDDPAYAGYSFTIADQKYSSEYEYGVIMGQTPQPGNTTTDTVPHIELVVSKGPEMVEMPDIYGWPKIDAEKELQAHNIRASFYMVENNGDYASNCVVSTSVEKGELIDVNKTTVNVYIAKEREMYTPPTEETDTAAHTENN